MSVPTYQVFIDWEDDGDWSGSGEDVSARIFSENVRWERGRDLSGQIPQPRAGALAGTIDNTSGDYAPENAASPLYGDVEPGRALKLEAVSGGTTALFRGALDEPQLDSERRTVAIQALGTLARLAGKRVSTDLYQDVRTDEALAALFDAAGLAATEYQFLDQGQTTFTAWWCDEDDAFAMLKRILDAEGPGAAVYEDPSGVVTFHSRHYRLTASRSRTAQATFRDTGADPLHVSPYAYARPLDGVIERAAMTVKILSLGSLIELWEYPEAPMGGPGALAIGPGQSVTFVYEADAPFTSIVWNVDISDARLDESPEILSHATTATRSALTITNPNSRTILFQGITLQGQPGTIAEYGVTDGLAAGTRTPEGWDPWPYLSRAAAQGLCDALVACYRAPRSRVAITVENATATDLAQVLGREISDRVTIVDANSYVNGDFHIERLAHEVGTQGQRHRVTLECAQPGHHGDWFVIGRSKIGRGRIGY